ncbi:MAG: UDP-N-acetylmuramate dehydrogenase [Deltaproteobacteria bacterium]|nr:UDP-N-acetylmuramate dehydrogenase [Deltaproteobacteria bacterium]
MTRLHQEKLKTLARTVFDEPMSRHTTLGVGGPVDALVDVTTRDELKSVLAWCQDENVPFFFLGGGSNLLVRDGGIRGIAIRLAGEFETFCVDHESGDDIFVTAGAAVSLTKLIRWSLDQGLTGIETLAGIPGCIGGNIRMNAGTHLGAIGDRVEDVTIMNAQGREMTIPHRGLDFQYRRVRLPQAAAILRAVLKLQRGDMEKARATFKELLDRRRTTQPVATQNCGCAFKNPDKTSAGKLIDDAGLKGVRVGGARVSPLHANFILNEGNATAHDVIVLLNLVRERVKEESGVLLEHEVVMVGEEKKRSGKEKRSRC